VGEIDERLVGEDTLDAVEIVCGGLCDENSDADGGECWRQDAAKAK